MLEAQTYEDAGNPAAANELRDAVAANNSLPAGDMWMPAGVIVWSKRLFSWMSRKKPSAGVFVREREVKINSLTVAEGRVNWGSTQLSRAAQHYRTEVQTNASQNVAVFLVHEGGDKYKVVVAPNVAHGGEDSERVLDDFLAQQGVKPEQVVAVYSERAPCGPIRQNCKALLETKFPKAKVSYSYGVAETDRAAKEIYDWQELQRNLRLGRR